MTDKWEHIGPSKNIADRLISMFTGMVLCTTEIIRLERTGEYREVFVAADQSIEGAVNRRQFTDLLRNAGNNLSELERLRDPPFN
jgi:Ca2+-binding EF-hand superfamily protein